MSTVDNSFGSWVKRRRRALGLTQQELAQRVGCSLSLISRSNRTNAAPRARSQSCWQALQKAQDSGAIPVALYALVGIATVHAQEGATELGTYGGAHPSSSWQTRERAERLRSALKTQFTPQEFETVEARVQDKTFETLVEEVLTL